MSLVVKFLISLVLITSVASAQIKVAITVDDLPLTGAVAPGTTRMAVVDQMLAVFHKHGLKDVWGFINAEKIAIDPSTKAILEKWVKAGHKLGNHSYSHQSANKISLDEFKKEVLKNESLLKELASKHAKFYRFPFLHQGDTPEKYSRYRSFLKEKGYQIAEVTVDFNDWAWNDPFARCQVKNDQASINWMKESFIEHSVIQLEFGDTVLKKILKRPVPHVLLLHVGAFDAEMMSDLIEAYKKK